MHHARDRPPQGAQPSDALSHLRFVLETMPGSRKYVFTPATRAEILAELYDAFWGPNAALFLPGASATLPSNQTLHQAQVASGFSGTGISDPPYPGKVCSRTIVRGESCFRCRQVLFSSCRIVLHRFAGIAASTRAASCARNVSTPLTIRTTTSVSTLPSSPGDAATAVTRRHGRCQWTVHTTRLPSQKKISPISPRSLRKAAQGRLYPKCLPFQTIPTELTFPRSSVTQCTGRLVMRSISCSTRWTTLPRNLPSRITKLIFVSNLLLTRCSKTSTASSSGTTRSIRSTR